VLAPVLAVLAAVALAACAVENPSTSDSKDEGPPRRGGELTLTMSMEPRSLDPLVMINNWGIHGTLGHALYGSLIGEISETGSASKGLIESMESDDKGRTWTLRLKDGLKFSDGSVLDAEAVAFNWKRHKEPDAGSQSRSSALMIKTLKPESDGRTLKITLEQPAPQFAHVVVNSSLNWIASPDALDKGAEFNSNPVAAGPFAVKTWGRGDKISLVRNEHYHEQGKPYLDGLTVRFNPDEPGRLTTLQSGGTDIIYLGSPAYAAKAEEAGLRIAHQKISGGGILWFNARFAPFNDVRARTAVAKAIEPKALNEAVYMGKAEVPTNFFAKTSPFYSEGSPVTGYDKQGAQQLFDELAAENRPVKFTLSTSASSETKKLVEAVQSQLRTYRNVDAKIEVLDGAGMLAKTAQKTYQVIPNGLTFEDPEPLLYLNMHGKSSDNRPGLKDAQLDAALLKGREATAAEERKEAYAAVVKRLAELNPGYLYVRTSFPLVAGPKVGGLPTTYKQTDVPSAEIWRKG
jgi:peptide/nickel transport system substrate-binding protein